MSQTFTQIKPVKIAAPGLPQGPLTPAQQVQALSRIQAQAEQRVQLGVQLFKAAEAQTARHREMLDGVKTEQAAFRAEVEEDITRSFHAYDAWIGQVDADLTSSIKALEDKMARLQKEWQGTQSRIEGMVARSERLLSQTRDLMASGPPVPASAPPQSSASPASSPPEAPET
jgi:chromosome segregation ATPase